MMTFAIFQSKNLYFDYYFMFFGHSSAFLIHVRGGISQGRNFRN